MKLKKVVIVGVGLIGGSISKALLEKGLAEEVVGVCRRQSSLDRALKEKAISSGYVNDYDKAASGADIVFIATPVQAMEPLETTDILLQSQLKEMCQRNLADQEEIDKSHRLIENFRDRQNFSKNFSVFEADLAKVQKEQDGIAK